MIHKKRLQTVLLPFVVTLLAVPVSMMISCCFFQVCNISKLLLYQWPSYVACYVPYLGLVFLRYKSIEAASESYDAEMTGIRFIGFVYLGVILRFAATLSVLIVWSVRGSYLPVYVFLMHIVSFFAFQLASLLSWKESAKSHAQI